MRLIDADELTKDRVENDPVRIAAECVPTAFDKEKVIEELRSEASRWHESGVNETPEEYIARKYGIRGDDLGIKGTLREDA